MSLEFLTESHPGTAGRQIVWPRGRVLGGSSAINGLVFMRGQKEDFNDWFCTHWPGPCFMPDFPLVWDEFCVVLMGFRELERRALVEIASEVLATSEDAEWALRPEAD